MDRVSNILKECGVKEIRSSADNIVNAHVASSDNACPAILVVMPN